MLRNFNLSTKLNLLLAGILLALIVTIGLVLSRVLQSYAEQVVTERALLLMETMSSVRNYTNTQVKPELAARLETEPLFLPQTIPAYSAREVFEHLRTNDKYNSYFYKEATLNPTNLRDKADEFETEIVNAFRDNRKQQTQGFRSIPGGDIFYIARPLKIEQQSCLSCHGIPEDAPASQIATYGSDRGFGWQLNEIVGAQMISVPASQVIQDARNLRYLVVGTVVVLLLLAIALLNFFLKFTITDPINKMSSLSKKLSTGDMEVEFEQKSKDEIGILAASLNRLKISLKMAMDMLDQK